jgi:predicted ribosome quality control (RQC) complex YloA/Tae2 family protein
VLEKRARAAAPRDFKLTKPAAGKTRKRDLPRPPHRTFLAASGVRILVGKGAEKNDELTFHVARPRDLWLHAKNRTGAHVIVPLARDASCPPDVLVEAAHLAAHFSEAREEDLVEVQYVARRYLRKPRGSPPGLVVVDREKVMILRRQPALLRALLEREVDPA